MVKVHFKRTRSDVLRRRHPSKYSEQLAHAEKNASFQGLPFGKCPVIAQALNRMQSDMRAIGFSKKTGPR